MASIDKVVAIGVNLHVKLLAILYVCFSYFSAVAVVYVVVCSSVNEK